MGSMVKAAIRGTASTLFGLATLLTAALCAWGLTSNQRGSVPPDIPQAAASAKNYILQRPIDAAGWIARADADFATIPNTVTPLANQAITVAATLAPVDPQVIRARMFLALKLGDTVSGLSHAANIATMFPTESRDAFSILRAYSSDPNWPAFFQAQLTAGWPAAEAFLIDSCQSGATVGTLLTIAQPIIRRQPLSENTVTCIGTKAISEGLIPTAYWLWLNALATLPTPLGNVFNGDFEQPSAGRLFDWRITAGGDYREGFAAAIRPDDSRGSRNKVLLVRFNGRALKPPVAQQFLALAPGRYTLSYSRRDIGLSAPASSSWALRCVPPAVAPTLGAATQQSTQTGWIKLTQDVVIPEGCSGQLLDLELGNRLQLAQGLQGSVLFDDVSIVRR